MKFKLLGSLLGLFCLASASSAFAQTTWYVDGSASPGGDGSGALPYDSIQSGISSSTTLAGDTLLVLPGNYNESLDFQGKSLRLSSTAGSSNTAIVATSGSAVYLGNGESAAHLEGFRISGGTGTTAGPNSLGGGVCILGASATLVDCVVSFNSADLGGGIYADGGGALNLQGTRVKNNQASAGGGVHANGVSLVIDGCFLENNQALEGEGGGLWSGTRGSLTVTDTEVSGNYVWPLEGGGVFTTTPAALFQDCLIRDNDVGVIEFSAGTKGGGISCTGAGSQMIRCTITENHLISGYGGGFYGTGQLVDCEITLNTGLLGGGAYAVSLLTMEDCTIAGNKASSATGECGGLGGGVHGGEYTNCEIMNNRAFQEGGGAYLAVLNACTIQDNTIFASCHVDPMGGAGISQSVATDCVISGNVSGGISPYFHYNPMNGGGASYSVLDNCQLLNNGVQSTSYTHMAEGHPGLGGGAFDCQLTDCLIRGNFLESHDVEGSKGAGIFGGTAENCRIVDNHGVVLPGTGGYSVGGGAGGADLTRCELSGNSADYGGGAWNCTLTNCSLTNNTANLTGGAVSAAPPEPGGSQATSAVMNSVLWGNAPDEVDANGLVITTSYSNIAGNIAGPWNISSDPYFWDPATSDVHLQANSPCIDAGNPASPRDPDGSRNDMGAYPFDANYVPQPTTYCVAKENSAGCVPSMGYLGSPSVGGADDFFAVADQMMAQKPCIAIWSHGAASNPFFGGTLCLAPQIHRTPPSVSSGMSGCEGSASFHFSHGYMASKGLVAGDRLYVQFWQRDPAHSDGTGVGLSNGLSVYLIP